MERVLIVNADDYGLSKGQNYGIIEACKNGLVTSTKIGRASCRERV